MRIFTIFQMHLIRIRDYLSQQPTFKLVRLGENDRKNRENKPLRSLWLYQRELANLICIFSILYLKTNRTERERRVKELEQNYLKKFLLKVENNRVVRLNRAVKR